MTRPSRGLSLGAVLLVITLLVTLAFSLASLSVSQLTMVSSLSSREEAENAAQAVISLAVERLQTDSSFGSSVTNNTLNVTVNGAEGWLTFNQARGLPWSSNNLLGTGVARGWQDGVVAPGSVRLLAEGTSRGARQRLEAVLRVPALPTLAAGGPVNALGGVTIAAVETVDQIGPVLRREPEAEPQAADLLSNSAADPAVALGPGTSVAGDVQAVGNIRLADPDQCTVGGEVRGGSLPMALPQVNLLALDPAPCLELPAVPSGQILSGRARSSGSVTFNGDLELDSAFLFVGGDLHVRGGVKGRGAIVVLGTTTIENGCSLDAGHRLALLSRGNVTLTGGGSQGSFFQGLVYTEGSVQATRLTVVGSVLARGDGPVGLTDSSVISLGGAQDFLLGADELEVTMIFRTPDVLGERRLTMSLTGNPDEMTYEMSGSYTTGTNGGDNGGGNGDLTPGTEDSVAAFWTMLCEVWGVSGTSDTITSGAGPNGIHLYLPNLPPAPMRMLTRQYLIDTLVQAMQRAQAEPAFEYRPSRLWRWEDRIRVCLWRKLN